MILQRITTPGLAIHSYLVGDSQTKQATVIDPVRDIEGIVETALKFSMEIRYILETHVHADFISGAKELKVRLNGKPEICCSGMGGTEWIPTYADRVIYDGDELQIGALKLKAIHTPGHTPEHLMWALFEQTKLAKLFTGDFLFVGDVGRPDLLGGNEMEQLAHQLYSSVFDKLPFLPEDAEIHPAHGAGSMCGKALSLKNSSTLGQERHSNPALQPLPEGEWIGKLMRGMPPAPSYFSKMKKVNVSGPAVIGKELPGIKGLSAQEVDQEIKEGALPIDIRPKESFAPSHIPGSINIPFGPQLATWAGSVIPLDARLILILEDADQLRFAIEALLRIGFDSIAGYLEGGIHAWEDQRFPSAHLQTESVMALRKQLESDDPPLVLDVRTDEEWIAGHVPGAKHLHGGLVTTNLEKIPADRKVAVMCASGSRSSIIASVLQLHGFQNVVNVFGGINAWKQNRFPIETQEI